MKPGDLIKVKAPERDDTWYHGVILERNYESLCWEFDTMWCAEISSIYVFDASADEIEVLCEVEM